MSIVQLIKTASDLLDRGTLRKDEEHFVSSAVTRFGRGQTLISDEITRLREIVDVNS